MKTIEYLEQGEIYYDEDGQQIWIDTKKYGTIRLLDIRGWGHLCSTYGDDEAVKIQDSLGKYIVEAIQEKLTNIKKGK